QPGWDGAEERNLGERAAARMRGGNQPARLAFKPAQGAFRGKRIDVTLDTKRASEPEVRLNFPERRRHALLTLMRVDKIEDLLLPIGERFVHSVHVDTF
ncbi:MAG: hypothetical protein ABIQ12_14275, partial [Opitutaceae bacterium]